ncbi:MAG: DUF4340 domain-containing protein [Sphingobacteriales bacterium]|nr:MAG: DUF4340 domain-containing protein [Sphingobacteriales bacterium]
MRNTFLYILAFLLLAGAAWFFLVRENDTVFSSDEAGFTVRDTGSITKIFLSDHAGSLTLTKTDSGWRVNDQYPALPASLHTLFEALHNQMAIGPVPQVAHNNVIRAMSVSATKVEIYGAGNRKIRTFFVGNEAADLKNTYMLMEGAKRPYIVGLRGFDGFLTPRYSPRLYDWRDRTVFNIAPDQIRKVDVTYPNNPDASFTLTAANNNVQLTPALPSGTPASNRMRDYLGFFQAVNAESYVNGTDGLDSLIAVAPSYANFRVTTADGRTQTANLYWMVATQRTSVEGSIRINGVRYDPERQYAVLNGRDTLVVQELLFHKLLQPRTMFYETANADTTTGTP